MRVTRPLALPILVPLAAVAIAAPFAAAADAPGSPQALLKEASANLKQVKSFRIAISETDDDGRFALSADVTAAGRVDLKLQQGGSGVLRLRKVPGGTYLRADAKYWKGAGGTAAAKKLADRWIELGKSDAKGFGSVFTEVAPKRLAACLSTAVTGTLSLGAPASVGGTKARVIVDAGDKPGAAPGKLYLSASGKVLPLRLLQTGKVTPGGKETSCSDPDDTSTASDVRFSRYDQKVSIATPKNAIELPEDGGSDAPSLTR